MITIPDLIGFSGVALLIITYALLMKKLEKKVKDVGVTLVPTLIFVAASGYAKLKFSVAKGKKLHDKRQSLKDKDISRDIARMMD